MHDNDLAWIAGQFAVSCGQRLYELEGEVGMDQAPLFSFRHERPYRSF